MDSDIIGKVKGIPIIDDESIFTLEKK